MTVQQSSPSFFTSRRFLALSLLMLAATTVAAIAWMRPSARAARALDDARSLLAAGNEAAAEQAASDALRFDGRLAEAALLAAEATALQGEDEKAVDYARQALAIDDAGNAVRLSAAELAARLNHHSLRRFADAEQAYRILLEITPDDVEANTGMAQLLGLCGRWREAIPFVLCVLRQNEPTDLLVLLSRVDGIIQEPGALEQGLIAAPDDPNPCIGLAWHARSEARPAEVAAHLQEALKRSPDHPAANVAWGRALLAAERYADLAVWLQGRPADTDRFPETWYLRGALAEHVGDSRGAIRCYWESAKIAPESKDTLSRLARLLAQDGNSDAARRFAEQVQRLHEFETHQDRVLLSGGHDNIAPLLELITQYERVGRRWEAYGWSRLATHFDPYSAEAHQSLARLARKVKGLPLRLTADDANIARQLDLTHCAVPDIPDLSKRPDEGGRHDVAPVAFRDTAYEVGIAFRYHNGTVGEPTRRMYEFTGGGIGAIDYDIDGYPDLYFTQGRTWPPDAADDGHIDRLYRNRGGVHFDDATLQAVGRDVGFGQGIACGDFDADGFPDILVANIGGLRLLRNNGDGTLTDVTADVGLTGKEWTTSCLMADLDGDTLPDIYAVNYVRGDDVFLRVCGHRDMPRMCMPFDFDGETDRLWRSSGDGVVTEATNEILSVVPDGKGLGVAAWSAGDSGRLSLFVANDTTPNFLFEPNAPPNTTRPSTATLTERGIVAGVALNGDGKATGCMGIAVGDVDDDGQIDLYITNFLAEPSTFYKGVSPGFFEDQTRSIGLHASSLDVLGFGTQLLDADLDGRFELFVANGHIDDLRDTGRPYQMPAQLYRWNGRQFQPDDSDERGPYFREQWLGRAVARLDWNGDGRDDLAIGHLDADSALLTNETRNPGRSLSLRLVGIRSNRDAVGTIVQAKIGGRTLTRQLTAGDGYQASNERRLVFGTGDIGQIDELVVRWPSGLVQTFPAVGVGRRVWLAEGRDLLDDVPN